MMIFDSKSTLEFTALNKLAVADAIWARMPADVPNMILALIRIYKNAKEWRLYIEFETNHILLMRLFLGGTRTMPTSRNISR